MVDPDLPAERLERLERTAAMERLELLKRGTGLVSR
jgi:hypothetical protein